VQALALLAPLLCRGYRRIDMTRVSLSTDDLKRAIEDDLLVLGGPKFNQLTRTMLDRLAPRFKVDQPDQAIVWETHDSVRHEYMGTAVDSSVTMDYGLIMRARNPLGRGTLVLLTGTHTYGIVAAARYVTEQVARPHRFWRYEFAALVKADVRDGYVCPPTLVQVRSLKHRVRAPWRSER
jgi:hypothetical protein